MAVLRAQDLTLKYDQRCVVDGLTAEIPEGKVTMIVGANACGKSTLLRGLSRLLKPAGGVVTLEENEGIGGEPSVVDVDQDGIFDVVYVPSTSGRVYRINPSYANGTLMGQRQAVCKVVDVPADLGTRTDAFRQRLHSPVATRVLAKRTSLRLSQRARAER